MKSNGMFWAGIFIGIGIFLGSIMIKNGISSIQESQRVVTVKGLSEKEVPANKVIWPIVIKDANNDLKNLSASMNRSQMKVLELLQSSGIPENEISLSAPDILDYQTERYASQEARYRYNGTSTITVVSTDVEKVRTVVPQIISVLIQEGVAISANRQYENPVRYDFTGLNDVKPEMIEEATKNARVSAEKFATDSDSKLGKIKTASQGQMSISDRDENSPHIKTLRVVTTIIYYLKE
ncbi:MAG: SIMPL domain-containing protein [Bacteroidales bacterium]|nr:SIMPL domain-containing protein [Bacteroidales bacterium]